MNKRPTSNSAHPKGSKSGTMIKFLPLEFHFLDVCDSSLQISIYQIHQIFNISYFPQFNLSFEKKIALSKNAQKSPKNLLKTA